MRSNPSGLLPECSIAKRHGFPRKSSLEINIKFIYKAGYLRTLALHHLLQRRYAYAVSNQLPAAPHLSVRTIPVLW